MQGGGEHVDHHLVPAARPRRLDGLVARRVVEGADDGGMHVDLSGSSWDEPI
jgi:hypothetical protein